MNKHHPFKQIAATLLLASLASGACAAPLVSRLTPPSELFASGNPNPPIIARFLPGQRFDLQATVRLDAGSSLSSFEFLVDGKPVESKPGTSSSVSSGLSLPAGVNATVVTQRAYSNLKPGLHKLSIRAKQSDGQTVEALGIFEIAALERGGRRFSRR